VGEVSRTGALREKCGDILVSKSRRSQLVYASFNRAIGSVDAVYSCILSCHDELSLKLDFALSVQKIGFQPWSSADAQRDRLLALRFDR
jgi:hypothetical protein